MKLEKVSKALAAALMIAAPVLLAAPDAALAKKPGNRPACTVGTAAYPTIQSAVNDVNCSTIGVPAGTFHENVTIGRSVSIRGEGPDRTVVDGSQNGYVFSADFALVPRTACSLPVVKIVIQDMTLTGGTGPQDSQKNGGAIEVYWVDLTVDNVLIAGNSAQMYGGGIAGAHAVLTVKDTVISGNTAYANCPTAGCPTGAGGGGIRGAGCPNVIRVYNSVISDNVSRLYGGGITLYAQGSPQCGLLEVKDSLITGNTAWAANGGGGIYYNYTNASVHNTTISGNAPDNLTAGPNPCPM